MITYKKVLQASISIFAIAGMLLAGVPAHAGFFDWIKATPLNQEAQAIKTNAIRRIDSSLVNVQEVGERQQSALSRFFGNFLVKEKPSTRQSTNGGNGNKNLTPGENNEVFCANIFGGVGLSAEGLQKFKPGDNVWFTPIESNVSGLGGIISGGSFENECLFPSPIEGLAQFDIGLSVSYTYPVGVFSSESSIMIPLEENIPLVAGQNYSTQMPENILSPSFWSLQEYYSLTPGLAVSAFQSQVIDLLESEEYDSLRFKLVFKLSSASGQVVSPGAYNTWYVNPFVSSRYFMLEPAAVESEIFEEEADISYYDLCPDNGTWMRIERSSADNKSKHISLMSTGLTNHKVGVFEIEALCPIEIEKLTFKQVYNPNSTINPIPMFTRLTLENNKLIPQVLSQRNNPGSGLVEFDLQILNKDIVLEKGGKYTITIKGDFKDSASGLIGFEFVDASFKRNSNYQYAWNKNTNDGKGALHLLGQGNRSSLLNIKPVTIQIQNTSR